MRTRPLLLLVLCLSLLTLGATAHPMRVDARRVPRTDATGLAISEIMYHPPDRGTVEGVLFEFLEVGNFGPSTIDLSGAHFSDGIDFTFAAGVQLAPGEHLVLAHSAATFAATYGFAPAGEYSGRLDNAGERITLVDAAGTLLTSVAYDDAAPWPVAADGCGYSLTLIAPADATDLDDGYNWRRSSEPGGSPGVADPALTAAPVQISEVLAHTDPPQQDSVELYNPTDADVDVGGWFLTDDPTDVRKFRIPDCTWMDAEGYLVLGEDELGFALSALGEEIHLVAADERGERLGYADSATFGVTPNGVSVGRYTTSTGATHFPLQITTTLGASNAGPRVGPVVISELMYHPPADQHEFIALTNITDAPVPLYDPQHPENSWRVAGVGDYALPPDTTIPPGGTLLVVPIAPGEFRSRYAIPSDVQIAGPYSGQLSNSSEQVALMQPDTPNSDDSVPYFVGDAVHYADAAPWPAGADGDGAWLIRRNNAAYGNDPANWRASSQQNALFLPLIHH